MDIFRSSELRGGVGAGDLNLGVIRVQVAFKAMELNEVIWEVRVDLRKWPY